MCYIIPVELDPLDHPENITRISCLTKLKTHETSKYICDCYNLANAGSYLE